MVRKNSIILWDMPIPTIKFTFIYRMEKVPFLDIRAILDHMTNELYTTLYTKPTDTRDFLHFTSTHPQSTKLRGPVWSVLTGEENLHQWGNVGS